MTYFQFKSICAIFNRIISRNKSLSIFKNSLSQGVTKYTTDNRAYFVSRFKYKMINDEISADDNNHRALAFIRVEKFSTLMFTKLIKYNYSRWHEEVVNDNFNALDKAYDVYYAEGEYQPHHWILSNTVNIDENINFKGSSLTVNNLLTTIDASDSYRGAYTFIGNVMKVFTFGKRNVIIAYVTPTGYLYIRENLIVKILEEQTQENIVLLESLLEKILLKYFEYYDFLVNTTIHNKSKENLKQDIFQIYKKNICEKFTLFRTELQDSELTAVKEKLNKIAQDSLNFALAKRSLSIYTCTDLYSYSKLLDDIINSNKSVASRSYVKGFNEGMTIGNKLEFHGWHAMDVLNLSDYRSTPAEKWWFKDIEIVPEVFMYRQLKYKIPEKKRKFKISKLFLSSNGKLRCIGNHPNVSGSNVCMGNLTITFEDSDLTATLANAEALLEIINYDSAYRYDDTVNHLEDYEQLDWMNTKATVRKPSGVRELGGDLDYDDDDEEVKQVEEKTEIIQLVTKQVIENKKVVGEIEINQTDKNISTEFTRDRSVEDSIVSVEQAPATLNIVGSDGLSLIPPVLVLTPPSMSLGDSNIIRIETNE